MKRTKENNALAFQPMENLQSALNLSVATNAELKKRGEDLLKNVNNAAKSEMKEEKRKQRCQIWDERICGGFIRIRTGL